MKYAVVEGSQSAHCCFEWTVVDTSQPLGSSASYEGDRFMPVCECWEKDDAILIAASLNATAEA